MKRILRYMVYLCLVGMVPYQLMAQDGEKLIIPLSDPQSPGYLKVGLIYGSISVVAHSGKEVIVEAISTDRDQKTKTKDGLRRIGGSGVGFTVEEQHNRVIVKSGPTNKNLDFKISVPRNFSLKLSAINKGNIYVSGVSGEMEISNTNGAITLENIGGSVVADALNKNITVTFDEVADNAPMAFTSLNGNLDITFPANMKATVKARTENGNVYTDFDMKQRVISDVDQQRTSKGIYKVKVDKWVQGDINGGGPQILFKTLNGNVMIRKK